MARPPELPGSWCCQCAGRAETHSVLGSRSLGSEEKKAAILQGQRSAGMVAEPCALH